MDAKLDQDCLNICSLQTHQAQKCERLSDSHTLPGFQTSFELGSVHHFKKEKWELRNTGKKQFDVRLIKPSYTITNANILSE